MRSKHPWFRRRHYLHFDPAVGYKCAQKIATSPKRVALHSFYPLISYHVTSVKLKHESETGKLQKSHKTRPIAYAAHLDSHIYSYYAWQLSKLYENELEREGLIDCVLAFRSLKKSNVDFAAAAFSKIRERESCSVIALDVSGFFDNLDHDILKESWSKLLGCERLPPDHFSVFKSLTKYSAIDKEILYKTLGISRNNPKNGRYRVCDPEVFRGKVRGGGLITTNPNPYGIPQGSPISALLSNIYMLGFDVSMLAATKIVGGTYYRYCDDMLFIVPKENKNEFAGIARKEIKKLKLDLNTAKTKLHDFELIDETLFTDKPLQYLGFTFDGRNILIRSAALARYSEKMKRGVRLAKATKRKRNRRRIQQGEPPKDLFKKEIFKRYSHLGRRNFIRYGIRAATIMDSKAIRKQLKPLWNRLIKEIET